MSLPIQACRGLIHQSLHFFLTQNLNDPQPSGHHPLSPPRLLLLFSFRLRRS